MLPSRKLYFDNPMSLLIERMQHQKSLYGGRHWRRLFVRWDRRLRKQRYYVVIHNVVGGTNAGAIKSCRILFFVCSTNFQYDR